MSTYAAATTESGPGTLCTAIGADGYRCNRRWAEHPREVVAAGGSAGAGAKLSTLRPDHPPISPPSKTLDDAYRAYFKSAYHNLLSDIHQYQRFYADVSSVIQGSGSGKSRLVKECSREFYVVYLCLRPEDSTGVPHRSELASPLLALVNSVTKENYKSKIDQFFAAMFHVIASKVGTSWLPIDDHGRVGTLTFWKYIEEENSADFAKSVKQTLRDWGSETPKLANQYMMEALRALNPSESSALDPNGFVVALDESRSLLQHCPGAQNSSLLLLLYSWMNSHISVGSLFLLLDTTSRVTDVHPTAPAHDPTGRIASRGTMLHRPIFEFPFLGPWPLSGNLRSRLLRDRFVAPKIEWTQGTSFNPLTDLFRFSRPLYLHVASKRRRKIDDALWVVTQTLFGEGDDPLRFTVAVCYRYALRPCRAPLQDKLLGSHGATLTAIHDDRSLDVRYLPEPLVGEALCQWMWDKLSNLLDTIVQQMTARELVRTMSPGDRGELASTVYLLHGYETATRQAIQRQHPQSTYSGLLLLGDWIAAFAGVPLLMSLHDGDQESVGDPDVANGHDHLTHLLSTCCVSFTGWTVAHEPVIAEMLTYAYCHRVGFVSNGNETTADMVLPLVLGPDETISDTALASAMAQRTTSGSTVGPVPTLRSSTPQTSAFAMDDIAGAAATETPEGDPEGLQGTPTPMCPFAAHHMYRVDLAQAKARRFLPTPACPGLGAVAVQVKNDAANLGLGKAFRYCRLQAERLLETATIKPNHVVSTLCMTGRGCVTAAQLPGTAPLPVLLFVEVGQPKLCKVPTGDTTTQPEPQRSAFVGVVINGFQEHLVGAEAKEKLMSLTATLSGPRASTTLTDQFVRDTVVEQLQTICARQDARLPEDFDVPSFTPTTRAEAAPDAPHKTAAAAPLSTWYSRLIDVASEGIDRRLLVWYPGTPPTSN